MKKEWWSPGILITLVTSLVSVCGAYFTLSGRVSAVENRVNGELTARLDRIEDKLDRLIERQSNGDLRQY